MEYREVFAAVFFII
jgi:hypothetical protein